jgi:hypothetical protein
MRAIERDGDRVRIWCDCGEGFWVDHFTGENLLDDGVMCPTCNRFRHNADVLCFGEQPFECNFCHKRFNDVRAGLVGTPPAEGKTRCPESMDDGERCIGIILRREPPKAAAEPRPPSLAVHAPVKLVIEPGEPPADQECGCLIPMSKLCILVAAGLSMLILAGVAFYKVLCLF